MLGTPTLDFRLQLHHAEILLQQGSDLAIQATITTTYLVIQVVTFFEWWKRDPFRGVKWVTPTRGWKGQLWITLVYIIYTYIITHLGVQKVNNDPVAGNRTFWSLLLKSVSSSTACGWWLSRTSAASGGAMCGLHVDSHYVDLPILGGWMQSQS